MTDRNIPALVAEIEADRAILKDRNAPFKDVWAAKDRAADRAFDDGIETALLQAHALNKALVEAASEQLAYMDICGDVGDLERNLRAALKLAKDHGYE